MIKLYYNNKPERNLAELQYGKNHLVWKITDWNKNPTSFYQLLNALGIDYEWSNNPTDSIVVADLGSIDFTNMLDNKVEELCNKYNKVLLFTSQEPWEYDRIVQLIEKFDNLYIMDCTTYHDVDLDRYLPFPSLIPLTVSTERCNTHIYTNGRDDNRNVFLLYNCMMYKWRANKHFLYHALDYVNKLGDGIVTFRSPQGHGQIINGEKDVFSQVDHDDCRKGLPEDFKNKLLESQSFKINKTLEHYHINDSHIDIDFRYWPEEVFDRTAFSLVCESESGSSNTVPFVTEKFIYPVLNGHPVFTYGHQNFNAMIKELGFALHEEVFNFDFDSMESHPLRAFEMVKQLRDMKSMTVRDLEFDYEVCRHNKHLINNRGSSLWITMRETMQTYLEVLTNTQQSV